ncbi:MAG: formate dehydrogenase subunit gamma [Paracoccaceae bacterium]|nr:formate dehydrogenase subunit gamma [Paracoccaceae bacterium]MDE2911380.1 formate dehydrogenase subunit gamma [Paracoccaceae bacterium]
MMKRQNRKGPSILTTGLLIAVLATFTPVALSTPAQAQTSMDRSSTGGAQTLEDIMARQRGEVVPDDFRRQAIGNPDLAAPISSQLGTLGGASDAELFRALRYGESPITVSAQGPAANVVIQDGGMRWLQIRDGSLQEYGGNLLILTLIVLGCFYALRGKIRIDGGLSGVTVIRFNAIERFGHWLLAGSFILLGISGLITLFGRTAIIPLIGKDAFAPIALASKWVHNNVAWAFMLALVIVFVCWVLENFPNRHDLKWLVQGGGLFSKGVHPPARKFNAGQKIIFWAVIILGASISASGLSLLFPFEMPMFAKTFIILNDTGIPAALGLGTLPETLLPHQEMQLAHLWHSIIAFVFMAMILAHIYLGSVGMQGAFDAMSSGNVDKQWAKEHHGIWARELEAKAADAKAAAADDSKPAPAK